MAVSQDDAIRAVMEANANIGRTQALELFDTASVLVGDTPTDYQSRFLNLNRPLQVIYLELSLRAAVTVANYTAVAIEAFQNMIQRITLQGTHTKSGAVVLRRLTGATAYVLPYLIGMPQAGGSVLLTDAVSTGRNRVTLKRGAAAVSEAGRPMTPSFLGSTAGSPYDVKIVVPIWMAPMLGGRSPSVKRSEVAYWLDPSDWKDLQLQVKIGDASALGDPTGATTALTAYGTGANDPQLRVFLGYGINGSMEGTFERGFTMVSETQLSAFTAVQNDVNLLQLEKRPTTGIVIKSGVRQTAGLTAGVEAFASVSDEQLDRTRVILDNKPIRNNSSNLMEKLYYEARYGGIQPEGYLYMGFCDTHQAEAALRAEQFGASAEFKILTDVGSASANNRQSVVQEQIVGGPLAL